jgi:hypothetical protein
MGYACNLSAQRLSWEAHEFKESLGAWQVSGHAELCGGTHIYQDQVNFVSYILLKKSERHAMHFIRPSTLNVVQN